MYSYYDDNDPMDMLPLELTHPNGHIERFQMPRFLAEIANAWASARTAPTMGMFKKWLEQYPPKNIPIQAMGKHLPDLIEFVRTGKKVGVFEFISTYPLDVKHCMN
jgi:hypothetical protein